MSIKQTIQTLKNHVRGESRIHKELLEDVLLENHLSTCVVDQIRNGKDKQPAKEILKVYKLKHK